MDFDLLVIGAGPGGYTSAIRAAQLGMKTAIVEKAQYGGTCLNRGCIPTKALLHSSSYLRSLTDMERCGICGSLSADFSAMHARKSEIVDELRNGIEYLLQANNVHCIEGEAQIVAPGTVAVGGENYTSRYILASAGSLPVLPPICGIDNAFVHTSDAFLEGSSIDAKKLVIIGGGVIGVEIASFYADIGREVCIIEAQSRILPQMDRELAQNLSLILKKRGIRIETSATVTQITRDGMCCFERAAETVCVEADAVLVSVGRRANSESLFAGDLAVAMDRHNIHVDENYMTSVSDVFAVGDLIGGLQLAHKAQAEGLAVVEYLAGKSDHPVIGAIPSCVYTDPEIACVGMDADAAKAAGIPVCIGKYIMSSNAKKLIESSERSFMKLVFRAEDKVLIGAQLMCPRATDMISELTLAVNEGMDAQKLLSVVRPHPTLCEGITEAVEAALGASLHTAKKNVR